MEERESRSKVSDSDGRYFEKFAKLVWSQGNRKIIREHENDSSTHAELQHALRPSPHTLKPDEFEVLYVEVLYTIKHKIGQTVGGHSPFIQDLYRYGQEAFGVSPEDHARLLAKASEEKPPIVALNCTVVEARDLEAKDADGFSDPYCMLGIMPASRISENQGKEDGQEEDQRSPTSRTESSTTSSGSNSIGGGSMGRTGSANKDKSPNPLRKFGQSIRRKVGGSEKGKSGGGSDRNLGSSVKENLPAKYIQTTSVKENTLNPVWNEKFRFDLEDVRNDRIHLDIWDHDDESNVFDAVSRLNQVKGMRGLGRYFKQVGQSARTVGSGGDVDDFLGCVTIKLDNIPSTGYDRWYKLDGRSVRSKVQGEIRLSMSLSTREDRGISEEDNWTDLRQHEHLLRLFVDYEIRKFGQFPPHEWSGELPEEAETILHQHAIQGDITDIQLAMCRWIAFSRKHREYSLNYKILLRILEQLDDKWQPGSLSRSELESLGNSFTAFTEYCMHLLCRLRDAFPVYNDGALERLQNMLKCLTFITMMELYRYSSPFVKDLSSSLLGAFKKGTHELYNRVISMHNISPKSKDSSSELTPTWISSNHSDETSFGFPVQDDDSPIVGLLHLVKTINADMDSVQVVYTQIFEQHAKINYLQAVYKSYDKLLHEDLFDSNRLGDLHVKPDAVEADFECTEYVELHLQLFELYFALQRFKAFREAADLPVSQRQVGSRKRKDSEVSSTYTWFRPVVESWLPLTKFKLLRRIELSVEVDKIEKADSNTPYSASAVDICNCLGQVMEVWRKIRWPDVAGRLPYITSITQILNECGTAYADSLHEKLRFAGYYDEKGQFDIAEKLCLVLNNIEHVRRSLWNTPSTLSFDRVAEEVSATSGDPDAGHTVMQSLNALHQEGCQQIVGVILSIISRVANKMRPEIRKNVFHLCWSPESVPVEKALQDLITYLDSNLTTLRRHLLKTNFCRSMQAIWKECMNEFLDQVNKENEEREESQSKIIFQRLYQSLTILSHFFNANDKGLTKDQLDTEEYKRVRYLLEVHQCSTDEVVLKYYSEKLREQQEMVSQSSSGPGSTPGPPAPFGQLSVRAYYNRDAGILAVEVLNARGLIPLDTNGLSDPFVIVELCPPHLFINVKSFKTKVVKNSITPVFNESFEFPVSLAQCCQLGGVICFTVMDHDMLTTDDYEGEAYLALGDLPGINTELTGYDALKTQNLPLIRPKYKEYHALAVLNRRSGRDNYAMEIIKKRKALEESVSRES